MAGDRRVHQPRKRFGQHFLADSWADKVVKAIDVEPGDTFLEIGPGTGALTRPLAATGAPILAVEIDRVLAGDLARDAPPNVTILSNDFLEADILPLLSGLTPQKTAGSSDPMPPARRFRVVGNLPYNISTPLLLRLLELLPQIRDLHFLLQKEVVDRLSAAPRSKDWGRLSVLTQYGATVEPLFDVGPEHFRPPPKVTSTFVRILPKRSPLPLRSRDALVTVLRNAFQQRRKTLRNALQSLSIDWKRVGVDPGTRADAVDLAGYVDLANLVAEQREHE